MYRNARARQKTSEILSSPKGMLSVLQCKLLIMQLAHLADLKANLRKVEEEILDGFSQFQCPSEFFDLIHGIDQTSASTIVAENWKEMVPFASAQHICAQAW